MEISRRYRINVSTSVKGIKTYDCTVEVTAPMVGNVAKAEGSQVVAETLSTEQLKDTILKESDALVAELDKRYPAVKE